MCGRRKAAWSRQIRFEKLPALCTRQFTPCGRDIQTIDGSIRGIEWRHGDERTKVSGRLTTKKIDRLDEHNGVNGQNAQLCYPITVLKHGCREPQQVSFGGGFPDSTSNMAAAKRRFVGAF